MEPKAKIIDLINQMISLLIILIFTFWVFRILTRIEDGQVNNAKNIDSMEQRILQRMQEPEKWQEKML
jgi:flagellar biogenesis protein FliO